MYTITAFAVVEEIPLESGFSGNVALGAAILQYENNMTRDTQTIIPGEITRPVSSRPKTDVNALLSGVFFTSA
jgi:hypothetical protein